MGKLQKTWLVMLALTAMTAIAVAATPVVLLKSVNGRNTAVSTTDTIQIGAEGLTESAGDPVSAANIGYIYSKDRAGVTRLYYEADDGTVTELGTGAASGDLTGNYPAPAVATGAITSAKIADGTITDTDVAAANKDGATGTASMRTIGSGALQCVAGNDSRLTDSRTPSGAAGGSLAGTYPSPTIAANAVTATELATGAVTSAKILDATITNVDIAAANKDGTAGTVSMRTLGTGSTQACAGDDSRLSDSRTPSGTAAGSLAGTYPNPTIAAGAVTTTEILNGTIGGQDLGADCVTSAKILDGTITDSDVATANKDGASATASMRTLGYGAAQALQGTSKCLGTSGTCAGGGYGIDVGGLSPTTNQLWFGGDTQSITSVYCGNGASVSAPASCTFLASGGTGTDIAGATLGFKGGQSTGAAKPGIISFQTTTAGTTGSTGQTYTVKFSITSTAVVAGAESNSAPTSNLVNRIQATNVAAGNTDRQGGFLRLTGGGGTGTGYGGTVVYEQTKPASTGSTLNSTFVPFAYTGIFGTSTAVAPEVSATPPDAIVHAIGGLGSNIAGGSIYLAAGQPTGNGVGGKVCTRTAIAGGSASTLRTEETRWCTNQDGGITLRSMAAGTYTGSEWGTRTAGVSTTNATKTTVYTFAHPDASTCTIEGVIIARGTAAGADHATFHYRYMTTRESAGTVVVTADTAYPTSNLSAGFATAAIIVEASTSSALTRVTGVAATNISWVMMQHEMCVSSAS